MKAFLHVIVLLVLASGCTSKTVDDKRQLKVIVAKYNHALIEAYKNQFYDPLRDVAGKKEVDKVGTIIMSYLQGNEIMESELISIDFRKIEKENDSATVRTSERWKYRWVHYKTNEEVNPVKEIGYELLYHLSKKEGKWRVERVEEVT